MSRSMRPTRRWWRCFRGSSQDRRPAARAPRRSPPASRSRGSPPSAEAVAWIAARFDGMALLWMLVAACAFMASRQVARSLRSHESRGDRARVHEQGIRRDRSGIDRGARVGAATRAGELRPRDRACARRRIAVAGDRRRVFRVPDVDLRRSLPVLSGDLAGISAPYRKMAGRAARERRLVAAGDAGSRAAPRLMRSLASSSASPPCRRACVMGAKAACWWRYVAAFVAAMRVAVLALGLVGERRRRTRPLRAGSDRRAGRGVAVALARRRVARRWPGSSPSCSLGSGLDADSRHGRSAGRRRAPRSTR